MSRWPITAAMLVFVAAAAFAQSSRFQPGANPMSNQGYDAAIITVATPFQVSRAIYNGNATACNFTATMSGGGSVQFQNNQPGTYNPIQATNITASSCTAGVLVAIY
jgi:hypothetical protein